MPDLDYNSLDIVQPDSIIVQDTFFLDTHTNLFTTPTLNSTAWNPRPKQPFINSVVFRENTYNFGKWGGSQSLVAVGEMSPQDCKRLVIEDEVSLSPQKLRLTRATQ